MAKDLTERIAALPPEKRARLEAALRVRAAPVPGRSVIPARNGDEPAALSVEQQRLWVHEQLESSGAAYALPLALRLRGPLDVTALRAALDALVQRQHSLRTRFEMTRRGPRQVVAPASGASFEAEDLDGADESRLMARIEAFSRQSFDLAAGPLFRTLLLRRADTEQVLVMVMHHIIADGWSMNILVNELSVLYRALRDGDQPRLDPLEIQFADWSRWQQEGYNDEQRQAQRDYWLRQLDGAPHVLDLPLDYVRPSTRSYVGDRVTRQLPGPLSDRIAAFARERGSTVYMVLLAGFAALLSRYTAATDLLIGTSVAGRRLLELEPIIGFFVNTLVMRIDASGEPDFDALLDRTRDTVFGGLANQDFPFAQLVDELNSERDPGRPTLVQVMFLMQNPRGEQVQFADLEVAVMPVDTGASMLELTVSVADTAEGLRVDLEYDTSLYSEETVRRLGEHYESLLGRGVESPTRRLSELLVVDAGEARLLELMGRGVERDYGLGRRVHELFELRAQERGESIALRHGARTLSYVAASRGSWLLGWRLRERGVRAGARVGLYVERSVEMLVGMLGIWKAGGSYVALDAGLPLSRLRWLLDDAGVEVVVTTDRLSGAACLSGLVLEMVPVDVEDSVEVERWDEVGNDVAYVMYTSGSTGEPKGVLGTHAGIVNRCEWMWEHYPYEAGEVSAQRTSLGFVDSVSELLVAVLGGVPTVVVDDEEVRDVRRLVSRLEDSGVSRVVMVPSLLSALLESGGAGVGERLRGVRLWVSSGEVLPLWLSRRFGRELPDSRLLNLYGSSEVSGDVTSYDTGSLPSGAGSVPLGGAIANTSLWVVDERGERVPRGVVGELYVGGAGVAQGYLGRAELSGQRFVRDERLGDGMWYRTGDRVRWNVRGELEYVGRVDWQVQLGGHRVEPQEVEQVLGAHDAVGGCAVGVQGEAPGGERLVAYVQWAGPEAGSVQELREYLRERLPHYMVPTGYVALAALPLTPSGKVDRRALPAAGGAALALDTPYEAPRTETEAVVAAVWAELLGLERVGVNDNFFDLGGTSLLAIEVVAALEQGLGRWIPPVQMMVDQTVARLARAIDRAGHAS